MKIALLSGAIVNAGDYLITKRSQELLQNVYPDAQIFRFIRNHPLSEQDFSDMNSCDVIVFSGGPYYHRNFYPEALPVNLDDLKPKIFMLGGGWWGMTSSDSEIWEYTFCEASMKLFTRAINDTGCLGCRDYITLLALRANRFSRCIMTGCPAWYDAGKITARMKPLKSVNKITISEPSDITRYFSQTLEIARYLRRRFPEAEIRCVFHRVTGGGIANAETTPRGPEYFFT